MESLRNPWSLSRRCKRAQVRRNQALYKGRTSRRLGNQDWKRLAISPKASTLCSNKSLMLNRGWIIIFSSSAFLFIQRIPHINLLNQYIKILKKANLFFTLSYIYNIIKASAKISETRCPGILSHLSFVNLFAYWIISWFGILFQ